ncbi:MAG: DUF6057 family protein [Prevotellaceae bacterium]|nr:DUF6057 family protein [Prevotellaceae bacterium]
MKPNRLKQLNIPKLAPWISIVIFILLAWYFLFMRNADVLFMQQMRSLFNDTAEFYQQHQTKPAGTLMWAGSYFTQFFYYPALGSSVLILLWVAIFFLMKKTFRVSDALSPILLIPLVCLLVSEIDLGYWIYYNKNEGYCFSQTLGLLIALILVFLFKNKTIRNFKFGDVIITLITSAILVGCYHFIGVYAMVAAATLAVVMLSERKWIAGALYIITAIGTPFIFRQVYDTLRNEQFFTAGLPVFESANLTNSSLTTPFVIAIIMLIALAIINKVGDRIKTPKAATIVSSLLLVIIAGCSYSTLEDADYDDDNYHAECKSYRSLDDMNWEETLDHIRKVEGRLTNQLVMFKNIALFNTHEIGSSMYDYDDLGMVPTPSDSLQIHTVNICAPIIYLHHGITNFAYHWCMEVQVEYGFNIAQLKIMVLSALVNGEGKLAEKYLKILSHTMFYKEWAEHYLPLARNPKLIGKYPELANIRELNSYTRSYTANDEGICENFIQRIFVNSDKNDSKYFQEVALVYCIRFKDIKKFWPRYVLYLQMHKGEKIPEIYQQAAYMFMDLEPQSAPDAKTYGIEFDQTVIDKYNRFDQQTQTLLRSGLGEEAIARQTKAEFGNTFWWVYYFNKGAVCY